MNLINDCLIGDVHLTEDRFIEEMHSHKIKLITFIKKYFYPDL